MNIVKRFLKSIKEFGQCPGCLDKNKRHEVRLGYVHTSHNISTSRVMTLEEVRAKEVIEGFFNNVDSKVINQYMELGD